MDRLIHNLISEQPRKGSHSESQNSDFTSPETSNGSLYEAVEEEEEDETLKPPPVTKKIQKIPFKKKKKYHTISDSLREKLIEAVEKGEKIKHAAKKFNINYSSAKSICQVFKKEGRSSKKTFKVRGGYSKQLQAAQKKESFDSSVLKSESDVTPDNTKIEPGVRTRGSLKIEANPETTPVQNSFPTDGWALEQKTSEEKPVQYSNILQQNAEKNEKLNNILAQNSVLMNKSLHHQPTMVVNPHSLVIHTPQVFMQNNFHNMHPSGLLSNLQFQRINTSKINFPKQTNIHSQNFPLLNSLFSSSLESTAMNNHANLSVLSQNYHHQQQQMVQFPPAPNNLNLLNTHNPAQMNNDIQSLLLNQMSQQRSMNPNPFQNNFNFF